MKIRQNRCPPGWRGLLDELAVQLDALHPPEALVFQVKEKFGGLRVYLDSMESTVETTAAQMEALIREAEAKAWNTCQECGKPGRVGREGRVISTRCVSCAPPGWEPTTLQTSSE